MENSSESNAITVKDLSFSYSEESPVLKDISFSIPKGKYTTILGANGSGKSTIAKLLIGLLEPDSGSIEIQGKALNDENLNEIREEVGIVFQNPDNQFIGSTVAEDIAFGLENQCVPTEQMQSRIEESAQKVGMLDYLEAEPSNLSGGQKQRVAIAGVLASHPDILIFDEATSMLDPQGKKQINEQIDKLATEKALTVISITHDMAEAAKSDHILVLDQGKAALEGSPQDIFQDEAKLKEMKLDLPFALKLSRKLIEQGILQEEYYTLEALSEALCQLKSKK